MRTLLHVLQDGGDGEARSLALIQAQDYNRKFSPVTRDVNPRDFRRSNTSDLALLKRALRTMEEHTEFCPNLHAFNENSFMLMQDVVMDRTLAHGRKGGEELDTVIGQSEESESYSLQPGFIKITCPGLSSHAKQQGAWSQHFTTWFSAIQGYSTPEELESNMTKSKVHTQDTWTLAVTRYDYANLYHTMADWYNVFRVLTTLQIHPSHIQILLIDAHPKGHLDPTWRTLFHKVDFLGHMTWSLARFPTLLWHGPQSKLNPLRAPCPPDLDQFSRFFLDAHGIPAEGYKRNLTALRVTFLWRRDYLAHPRQILSFKRDKTTIQRKIYNEDVLVSAVRSAYPKFVVSGHQLDNMTMTQQLSITGETPSGSGGHQTWVPPAAGATGFLFR